MSLKENLRPYQRLNSTPTHFSSYFDVVEVQVGEETFLKIDVYSGVASASQVEAYKSLGYTMEEIMVQCMPVYSFITPKSSAKDLMTKLKHTLK